jgi:multiple sugar transport system substrate-binding protein
MSFKKVVISIVCLMLVSSLVFAGAQKEQAPVAGSSVVLRMSWWGNQLRNQITTEALDMYAQDNPGVTFETEFNDWGGYWDKLAAQAAGNIMPDIIQMDYSEIANYQGNGLLLNLSPYIENGTLDMSDVPLSIVESAKIGDGIFGVVSGVTTYNMIYDKDIVARAGVTVPDIMTIDEFKELSRTIYGKTGVRTNYSYGSSAYMLEYLVRDYGYVLMQEGKLGVPDASYLEQFYSVYEDGVKEGWHLPANVFVERTAGVAEMDPIADGTAWCQFLTSNKVLSYEQAIGKDFGLAMLPADHGASTMFLKPSQFFSVTSNSKNPDEAVAVLNYLTNSIEANLVLNGERGIPIASKVSEAVAANMGETGKKVVAYVNKVAEHATPPNPPTPPGTSRFYDLVDNTVEMVCAGKMTAREAAQHTFIQGNLIFKDAL